MGIIGNIEVVDLGLKDVEFLESTLDLFTMTDNIVLIIDRFLLGQSGQTLAPHNKFINNEETVYLNIRIDWRNKRGYEIIKNREIVK